MKRPAIFLIAMLCSTMLFHCRGIEESVFFTDTSNSQSDQPGSDTDELPLDEAASENSIYLYVSPKHDGEIGGRDGVDRACQAALPGSLAGYSVHALVSINATDEIRDMPSNFDIATDEEILSTTGVVLATDWGDLLDGDLMESLGDASVIGAIRYFWTGSNNDGSLTENCEGFSKNGGAYSAVGDGFLGVNWLSKPSYFAPCLEGLPLVCAAFIPDIE